MYLAERLRDLREFRKLSQGDIEKRTGLLRCYISRVENGHTVPAIETLEKLARALEVSMYQLFYEDEPSALISKPLKKNVDDWASQGKGLRMFAKFRSVLPHLTEQDRGLLLHVAGEIAKSKHRRKS